MATAELLTTWLLRTWLVLPPFAVVVAAFIHERACADRYNLLPELAGAPLAAYALAAIYVGGHLWLGGAVLATIQRAGRLLPTPSDLRRIWGGWWWLPAAALVVVALDRVPPGLWFRAARLAGIC
jgi:hypothetical protein